MFKMATVAEIQAEVVRFQAVIGDKFEVSPNRYGLYVVCKVCGESGTHDRAYRMADTHAAC